MSLNTDMQWLYCTHDDKSYIVTNVIFACSQRKSSPQVCLYANDIEPTSFCLCCTWMHLVVATIFLILVGPELYSHATCTHHVPRLTPV